MSRNVNSSDLVFTHPSSHCLTLSYFDNPRHSIFDNLDLYRDPERMELNYCFREMRPRDIITCGWILYNIIQPVIKWIVLSNPTDNIQRIMSSTSITICCVVCPIPFHLFLYLCIYRVYISSTIRLHVAAGGCYMLSILPPPLLHYPNRSVVRPASTCMYIY